MSIPRAAALTTIASLGLLAASVSPVSAQTAVCFGLTVTVDMDQGQMPTVGDDVILGPTSSTAPIDALAGNDVVCLRATVPILGGPGDDILIGNDDADALDGGAGNDVVYGQAGNDDIRGGDGNDVLVGQAGDDDIDGDGGIDYVNGGDGDDELWATAPGAVTVDDGGNTLEGGPGNDVVNGAAGSDVMIGDPGSGPFGDDTLIGHGGADYAWGGGGADDIEGGDGGDYLDGHDGDDSIDGGLGDDVILGGAGADGAGSGSTAIFGGPGDDFLDAGLDGASMSGDAGRDYLVGSPVADQILGGDGDDIVLGYDGDDDLDGGTGSDYLWGGEGGDAVSGGSGDDYIEADLGDDDVAGDDGADTLLGGGGTDVLDGGADDDIVVGGDDPDTLIGGAGTGDYCFDDDPASTVFDPSCELGDFGDDGIVAYDTAWELPTHADPSEIPVYFDHLVARGFDGALISFLNHTAGRIYGRNGEGDYQVRFVDDELVVTGEHFDYMTWILDEAHARGLKVGFVPVWGQAYLNSSWWNDQCNDGMLTVDNARTLGDQIGTGIGNHPAIEFWIMGGDNLCWNIGEGEDVNIWREVVGGLEDAGITGDMTYHPTAGDSGGRYPRVSAFAGEPWVDFVFPQTGHCYGGQAIIDTIDRLIADFGKPVFLGESRYYETGSDEWCGQYSSTNRVDADDIAEDVQAILSTEAIGLGYGDWNRFNWCWPSTSGRLPHDDPCGAQGIAITYNTLGEDAFLRELGRF